VYAERGRADSLADRIGELIQQPEQRRTLGQALRARAMNRFSWDDATRRILAVYEAVLNPQPQLRAEALSRLQEGDHAHETR
jgi:glycosyltransferase involved in cell wall biosynthesis